MRRISVLKRKKPGKKAASEEKEAASQKKKTGTRFKNVIHSDKGENQMAATTHDIEGQDEDNN